ncbi:hypothetical protein [Bifidobacterium platyrrhinorum]|uniref:Head-to-tail stopper n=1 Tax=Bifidobacterium platyrrhinorum TaxID=2661628 RepID=A0A6L9SVS5_9BIFI|nr:hypothetical protein [Bifidobacterium platyrrhinorum]NEG56135.1 hypothetical protein [Bifidobacterium platyrrhinorum]
MSLLDDLNTVSMPGARRFIRLRARPVADDYDPTDTTDDWTDPEQLAFRGALASSSSMRTPDVLDRRTTTAAYLTVPDPTVDIRVGDRIRADPADGVVWSVTGVPSRDVNAFTGWHPTTEIQLTEWKG